MAFVYGTYSLLDKFMNGVLLSLISATVITDPTWLRMLTGTLPILVAISGKRFESELRADFGIGYVFASIGVKYMPQSCFTKLIE